MYKWDRLKLKISSNWKLFLWLKKDSSLFPFYWLMLWQGVFSSLLPSIFLIVFNDPFGNLSAFSFSFVVYSPLKRKKKCFNPSKLMQSRKKNRLIVFLLWRRGNLLQWLRLLPDVCKLKFSFKWCCLKVSIKFFFCSNQKQLLLFLWRG